MSVKTGTIETMIPSRLDRLPWAAFHWRIVFGLGTAWVLDGLEVTMVASAGSRLTQHGSGVDLSVGGVGLAGSLYIVGACAGALLFGQLCDRFGRKKLFVITLGLYIASTVLTAFSFAPWFFFLARFLTGSGIGGEYSAINSAIDELIPARARGRVDLMINGSYWFGSILGSASALFFLSGIFPVFLGWRLAFGVGAVIGLSVMFVRRKVPESPRWLFIHGQEDRAEAIVAQVEGDVRDDTGQELAEVDKSITVRQRTTIPFREIAQVAYKLYPRRAVLCLALFVGQAFLYNGITFNLGTLMTGFYKVSSSVVPVFIIIYAAGNLAGPLVLGRLFDTVGRKPMISGTYLGSALLSVLLAWLFVSSSLNDVTFIAMVVAVFFLASAGASAAYLTASEIFPMETRALAIAFFYAIGTAVGGISGPLLFGSLISSGARSEVATGFLIGAGVMAAGGVAEMLLGVRAAGRQLEDVARPLTVGDAKAGEAESGDQSGQRNGPGPDGAQPQPSPQLTGAPQFREQAVQDRARAQRPYRLGPGSISASRGWAVTAPDSPRTLDPEVRAIEQALDEHGPTSRRALAEMVGSHYWGPGVFGAALRAAVADGEVRRVARDTFALTGKGAPAEELGRPLTDGE
jgi:MFS family permease